MTDRLIGLPEGRARNHNRPQQVPALMAVFIEDVAVGAEHTLALSSTGDVYGWGSNSEGQVCDNYGVNKLIMFPIFHWFMYYLNNSMDIYHFVLLYFFISWAWATPTMSESRPSSVLYKAKTSSRYLQVAATVQHGLHRLCHHELLVQTHTHWLLHTLHTLVLQLWLTCIIFYIYFKSIIMIQY